MITQFIPAPLVKDCSKIQLFRDSEDPYVFYYLNSFPKISIDKDTGKPMFDYIVTGIRLQEEDALGAQQGHLVMTVDLSIDPYKEMPIVQKAVVEHIQNSDFKNFVKLWYPKYDFNKTAISSRRYKGRSNYGVYFEEKSVGNLRQVIIRPIDFKSGTASLNLISADLQGNFIHETKPTLFGDCNATFAYNLGTQESQKLLNVLMPEKKNEPLVNISATVKYELKFNAIARFSATAKINYKGIYGEFQDILKSYNKLEETNPKYKVFKTRNGFGVGVYSNGEDLYISKESLRNYLNSSNETTQNIIIDIKDVTENTDTDQYEKLILSALESQLANKVCEKLFEKVESLRPNDIQVPAHDINTTGSTTEKSDGKDNILNSVNNACYRLRREDEVQTTNFNYISSTSENEISIQKDTLIEVEKNPQTSLELLLNNYPIESMVHMFDSSLPYYQEMVVPVKVEDTNFEGDIAMISVRVIYKDKKGAVKLNKVFDFDKDAPSTKYFRVNMERNDKHELIDTFYYQTRIRYNGYDVYEKNMNEDAKWTPIKEAKGNGESIYVPYSDILNLCVECEAGDVAWDVIEKLVVEFKYKDAPEQSGATKEMLLTPDNPKDTWNCYMYKGTDAYQYKIHYFYQDGTDDWSQVFEGTSKNRKLVVNDKLSGLFSTKFDIKFQKSVERVRIIVRCQGKEEDSGWIYQADEWTWKTRLKEDRTMSYQYKYQYYLVNGDNSEKETEWTAPIPMSTESNGQRVEVKLEVNQISLRIDGESIDWNKWKKVYIYFKYDDDANNLHYDDKNIPPLKLNSSNFEEEVIIPVIDNDIRPTFYAEYIPIVGEDIIPSDVVTAKTINVLPNHAPPKQDLSSSVSSATVSPSVTTASGASPVNTPEPELHEPVAKDLCLTFSTKTMDWNKWMCLYIHIEYNDDVNDIHINEKSIPPLKMKQGDDDKSVSFQIKDPNIRPSIIVDYVSMDEIITTDATPVSDPMVVLPDAAPPKE